MTAQEKTAWHAGEATHHHGSQRITVHGPLVLEEGGAQFVFADAVALKVHLGAHAHPRLSFIPRTCTALTLTGHVTMAVGMVQGC